MNVKSLAVVVPLGGPNTILTVNVEHQEEIGLAITNNGPNAFDAFQVWAKLHEDGTEVLIADQAAQFSTPAFPLRRTIGTPVTLASSGTVLLWMSVSGIHTLILKASAITAAGTADIYAQAY